jgi:hypothetical protein
MKGIIMTSKEYVTWIMDKTGMNQKAEEMVYKENVCFAHSLSLKCDSVGWTEMNSEQNDMNNILDKMVDYATKNNYRIRGDYCKENSDFESDWYSIQPDYFTNGELEYSYDPDDMDKCSELIGIKAYQIPKYANIIHNNPFELVSENFRNICIENNFKGIDFYWIRDIGKYNATQFFGLIIEAEMPEFTCSCGLKYSNRKKSKQTPSIYCNSTLYQNFKDIGGILPKLAEIFYRLDVRLPLCLPKDKIPKTDVLYLDGDCRCNEVLIHKKVADALLRAGAIKKSNVTPVMIYDTIPKGYPLSYSIKVQCPSHKTASSLLVEYNKLKENPRLKRIITEKDALKFLRQVKKERKDDFAKALPKKQREGLLSSPYECLLPYYAISNGGWLSDEYYFLSFADSKEECEEFFKEMKNETRLDEQYAGIVIAKCADGDTVIIQKNGELKRISHEDVNTIQTWATMALFIYDSLEG